jgi:hypothetical protein
MNGWASFLHRAFAAEDTPKAGNLFGNSRQAQNESVDAHLKDFYTTAFSATRTQPGVNCAPRVLSGEK